MMSAMVTETREKRNEWWLTCWEEGFHAWHLAKVNPHLKNFFHRLDHGNLDGKRILVPLCGKCQDLKWFYDKGMSVVGIEVSELAVKEFFTDNGYTYKIEYPRSLPGCQVFRHDERLCIFLCDLFKLNVFMLGGRCDYLWDRGSLVAMIPEEHKKYWNLINSCLSQQAEGLLETYEYKPNLRSGPPHAIPLNYLLEILDDSFLPEELSRLTEDELPKEDTLRVGYNAVRVMYYLQRKNLHTLESPLKK